MKLSARSIFRRTFLYVGPALAGLAAVALLFRVSIALGTTNLLVVWFLPTGWTVALLVYVVTRLRKYWRQGIFWVGLLVLLMAHVLALRPVVRNFPKLRSPTYMLAFMVEAPLWGIILHALCSPGFRRKQRPRAHDLN